MQAKQTDENERDKKTINANLNHYISPSKSATYTTAFVRICEQQSHMRLLAAVAALRPSFLNSYHRLQESFRSVQNDFLKPSL